MNQPQSHIYHVCQQKYHYDELNINYLGSEMLYDSCFIKLANRATEAITRECQATTLYMLAVLS